MSSSSSSISVTRGWSELNDDILDTIIHRLPDVLDFINFGSVCRSWRSSSLTHRLNCHDFICRHKSTQIPWVLLRSPSQNNTIHFYDFGNINRKSYRLHIPEQSANFNIRFSSNGFLIYRNENDSNIHHVFNPLTGTHYTLPSTTAFIEREFFHNENFINKAIVDQRSRYVAVICDRHSQIMFAKPEDNSWTLFVNFHLKEYDKLDDIIFHKGRLYAITQIGTTYVFDRDFDPSSLPTIMWDPLKERFQYYMDEEVTNQYLVESPDGIDLFLLINTFYNTRYGHLVEERLFKLDLGEEQWHVVNSLEDLTLFLAYNSLICITASQSHLVARNYSSSGGEIVSEVNPRTRPTIKILNLPDNLEGTPQFWFVPTLA